MVTAPINKANIQKNQSAFIGHTEFLGGQFEGDPLMIMLSDAMRIAFVTGHIPLSEVAASLSENKIFSKIKQLSQSLIQDFGISKPKIAVIGLNPHAGEDGMLGKEEKEIIELLGYPVTYEDKGKLKQLNAKTMKFDLGETTFDLQDTTIVDLNIGSGGAFTATMYNTQFVIDDRIVTTSVSANDDFGRGVCIIDNTAFVGAPDDDGNITADGSTRVSNDGTVTILDLN